MSFDVHVIPNQNDLSWTDLGDSIVILRDQGEGEFHELNESASILWRTLEKGCHFQDLVSKLTEVYEIGKVDSTIEAEEFLQELLDKNLVELQ